MLRSLCLLLLFTDLPMQQLSEMFNVNHFIISQANPHAVMFASYNHLRSVWSNPISGSINAVITFLKDRCRSWFASLVELVGTRRFAPQQATSRGLGSKFFVQEYEGRECDISLIPWINHRSLMSAFMHCLYNPSDDETIQWIAAAERETWKHIPAIKSHIAEEVTLDHCVQRLRKRVVAESWEKRRQDSTHKKIGDRVPSFFNSPSLVNLGGLGVGDQTNIEGLEQLKQQGGTSSGGNWNHGEWTPPVPPPAIINPGWQGLGLRGNRSSGSLERSPSASSGLFIDREDGPETTQAAGEQTNVPKLAENPSGNLSEGSGTNKDGYIKTTSMARFYYRNSEMPRAQSQDRIGGDNEIGKGHYRRQSKSHTDLTSSQLKP